MNFLIDHDAIERLGEIEDFAGLVMIRLGIYNRMPEGRRNPQAVMDALDLYVRAVRRCVGADDEG